MWISFFIAISLFIKTWFVQIPIDAEPKTNADIQTELTDCFLQKTVTGKELHDTILIVFTDTCDPTHKRGIYVNEEFRTYAPFTKDFSATAFENIYESVSPTEEDYILTFGKLEDTYYTIYIDGSFQKEEYKHFHWKIYEFTIEENYDFEEWYSVQWTSDKHDDHFGKSGNYHELQTEETKQAQKEKQAAIDAQPRVYEKILWENDEYMMIEYCKTGFYAPMLEQPKYMVCNDELGFEGLSFKFTTKDGTALPLSETLSTEFVLNQHNLGGSVFKDTFTPDGKYWLYIDYWTQNEHRLMAHNIQTGEDVVLMSFLEFEYTACNDVTFFGWNPGETKLGIIASNEESSQYPTKTKLFILTIENGLLIQKNKYNISVNTDCSANNGAIYAIDWLDDNTVQYYDPNNNPFKDYNAADYNPEFFDTLYLQQFDTKNPIGWDAEWVQTEDVE